MPKPKKDWKALNIKIQSEVYEALEKYCEDTGQSKTVVVEYILSKAFKEYKESK
ncbi:RepB family protein [uncultured Holdemanella sp.]|uniref:RepB family protein n=1 Tax=uncultured Holdemanella sp. TaxID=1763549 RepID=UPI0025D0AA7A|nr:RepB family protein [uncultured Holdemanella sp.]